MKDPDKCKRVKVYIADCTGFGLIVYDHQTTKAWRVENKYVSCNCENIFLFIFQFNFRVSFESFSHTPIMENLQLLVKVFT